MAQCTQYFEAVDEDGDKVSFDVSVSIRKWNGEYYAADGLVNIPRRSIGSCRLTTGAKYEASATTRPDGYLLPSDVPFEACGSDIKIRYKTDCPTPTVSISSVSDYTPASGEQVNFTSYASGGSGHSISSRKWDFGDGTTTTTENPSKTWTNTSGADVDYTIKFTATNDCGKSDSTTTEVTVSSEPTKHGLEIQFPSSMNGKQLIAHGAISTVLGLWWTGPHIVDGITWKKGRCTWDNIDSSKTYAIQVGDACECELEREEPTKCAGTFGVNDYIVILIRNPGFDFRVYSEANVYPISDSTFGVLYIDQTSGDIIDEAFTGRICGLLGVESGSECDAFWAEFYDPIFVANYMDIMATGKDMFGNERELGWLDHVAFVASLVGSLPVFNLFPFAGITKNLGTGIVVIARKVKTLAGNELDRAGGAMADICVNAPEVIGGLVQSQLDEVRAALIKVYGDVQGNKYIDDALAIVRPFVKKYYDILEDFRTGVADLPTDAVDTILSHGQEAPNDILSLIDEFKGDGTLNELCNKLMEEPSEYPLGSAFRTISTEKAIIPADDLPDFVLCDCKVAESATAAAEPIPTMQISEGTNEIAHKAETCIGASELGFDVRSTAKDIGEATLKLADEPTTSKWKLIARDLAGGRFRKVAKAIKKMSRREKFMAGWFFWELMSFVVGFMLLKALGIFPGDRSFRAFQRCEAMSTAFFTCKSTCENELWDALEEALVVYEKAIISGEEYLENNRSALEREHSAVTLESAVECAHINIDTWRGCLADHGINLDAAHTAVVFTSNVVCMAYVDGHAIGTVFSGGLLTNIMPGERTLEMRASRYDGCEETVTLVESGDHAFHCDLVEETCTKPAPAITGPLTGVVKQAVQFTGAAITESEITWWSWDFGDGDNSHDQSPSHMYWNAGTYIVKLTVTDDCGNATAEHTIIISTEGEIPDVPTPTEEAGTLLVKTPLNAENDIECNRGYASEIFVDGKKVSSKAPFTIPFGTNKYISGYGGECGVPHKVKVRLAEYQDVEQSWTINDGDDKTWTPKMYLDSYVPPADTKKINFYLPEGATMTRPTELASTTRLISGLRRINDGTR